MKVFTSTSIEKNRVTVVAEDKDSAVALIERAFKLCSFWGFDANKVEEIPMEGILPKPGEVMISYVVRM